MVEELENRVQPANLVGYERLPVRRQTVTRSQRPRSASLVYVKAEFKAHDLPAGASYVLRYTLDGSPRTSDPINWGAGIPGTSNWVGILGNWVVKPGPHTAR